MGKILTGAILGCVILAAVVWQFGYLSKQASAATKKLERATAAARAEKLIGTSKKHVDALDDKAREYRIKAGTLERRWLREQEALVNLDAAMKQLAAAAKEAGLPSPANRESLTEQQRAMTLKFGSKTIGASEVYSTLDRWDRERDELAKSAGRRRETIDHMRVVAGQFVKQRVETTETVARIEGRLKELSEAKDFAQINAELAAMEAAAQGAAVGDLGETLDTIQEEIDELDASAEEYRAEAEAAGMGRNALSPEDVVAPSVKADDLEALWE